ncbi:MAG: ABC transporter ATP-binding protein [Candidatus Bathyarchaeia archaeon]
MTDYAIELKEVSKFYEKLDLKKKVVNTLLRKGPKAEEVKALDRASLKVKRGEIFGLLGPNGAGKTTMIKVLSTILTPDSGSASVNGSDVVERSLDVRRSIGIVPEDSERGFSWRLSTWKNLLFYAREYMVENTKKRVEEVLQIAELDEEDASKWFQKLSKGTKQKVAIARALLPDAPVLFMDEPQRSLDVLFVSRLKELIREKFGKSDRTIFLSSHDMHLIEETCDRVAVINKGRIAMVKRVSELKYLFEDLGTMTYTMQIAKDSSKDAEALAGMLRLVDGVERAKSVGPEKVEICIERNRTESINRILQAAMDQGYMIVSLAQTEASLEQAMMKLLKEERSDES